jgi:hypothetical protein
MHLGLDHRSGSPLLFDDHLESRCLLFSGGF